MSNFFIAPQSERSHFVGSLDDRTVGVSRVCHWGTGDAAIVMNRSNLKLANLPKEVIDDLCQDDRWRLDIDPGLDAKHEF